MRRMILMTAVLLAPFPTAALASDGDGAEVDGGAHGGAVLEGKVLRDATEKPVARAEVLAYHLESENLFRSTADGSGKFRLKGLPHGYFDLAVRVDEEFFPVGEVVHLPPKSRRIAVLKIIERDERSEEFWNDRAPREYLGPDRGGDGAAAGVADLESRMTGREFWRTGKGVAIIASIGGAGLLALAVSDDEASAFDPLQ